MQYFEPEKKKKKKRSKRKKEGRNPDIIKLVSLLFHWFVFGSIVISLLVPVIHLDCLR